MVFRNLITQLWSSSPHDSGPILAVFLGIMAFPWMSTYACASNNSPLNVALGQLLLSHWYARILAVCCFHIATSPSGQDDVSKYLLWELLSLDKRPYHIRAEVKFTS